jgi:hypothetical protein
MTRDPFETPLPVSIRAALARHRAEMDAAAWQEAMQAREARILAAVRRSDAWRWQGSARERVHS